MPQKRSALNVEGTQVTVSNLEKVLFPAAEFTKAAVIDYYIRVSGHLLPHLKDRPVTLKRYPDGVRGEHFYEKDAPSYTPEWVQTYPVPRRSGESDIRYILINDLRTLVWCANLANIEIHPFLHKAPRLDEPTSVVFDLDPGEGTDVLTCGEVALQLKEVLASLRLKCWAKVSGSKGIQVYIPLNSDISYAATQPFARTLAQLMETRHRGRIVSEMAKELRTGKVFIDWSQNADYKTTAGVYSLRAKRAHPYVSMPVAWDELAAAVESRDITMLQFEPAQALERLQSQGDLFAPVLVTRQELPADFERALRSGTRQSSRESPARAPAKVISRASHQGSRRRFVIQKHAASHLHYDFRLEMHGALKSWAMPKGVPYDLDERRLAAGTEDHPLEYIDFEGIIPKGQYGGGTVMVWDSGTWEVIEGNYYKGFLRFYLEGTKLKGEWVLQKAAGEQKNWYMVKTGSAMDRPTPAEDDSSALTGRSMAEIAAASDRQWQSNRTEAGIDLDKLPSSALSFIEPMQAKAVERLPEGEQWLYEIKFDGYRTLAVCASDVRLLSRRNNVLNDRFGSIATALSQAPPGSIFDGEVVALDETGRPSFNILQNHLTPDRTVLFYVFDLLAFRGRDVTKLPLSTRRALLEKDAMQDLEYPVLLSQTLSATPEDLVRAAREQGLEGILAKRSSSIYEPGKRSGEWVKLRVNKGQELVIGGYKPGSNGFDYLLAGYYDEQDRLMFVAKLKNGFTPKSRRDVEARFAELESDTCPFANLPEARNARRGEAVTSAVMAKLRWLRPELVAQAEFADWTDANHLRHSRFMGLRDDKDPRQVRKEF